MRVEQYADGMLHVLVVDAEHELTEQRTQLRFLGGQEIQRPVRRAFAVIRTFKPSIPLARNASVGLPVIERRDPVASNSASRDSLSPHVRSTLLMITAVTPDDGRSGMIAAATIVRISCGTPGTA